MISMENKSAMQQMIAFLEENIKEVESADKLLEAPKNALLFTLRNAKRKATELLEVEKKNIVEAFNIGVENCGEYGCPMYLHGEEYYSTKFNNQK